MTRAASSAFFEDHERLAAAVLLKLALAEDLSTVGDLTSQSVIPPDARGQVRIVSRKSGVLAGLPIVEMTFAALGSLVEVHLLKQDGDALEPGDVIALLTGPVRTLLTAERTALNFLTLLSGTATLTRQFVQAVAGTSASILDTRKTIPGYRSLQKYAVRCGGGANHRQGLYDAVMIKDNHLAAWVRDPRHTIADAIAAARHVVPTGTMLIVEVDTLEQLRRTLPAVPDIILLDNMNLVQLREAVAIRDQLQPAILLEASGGVTLRTVAEIAQTGVDRISIGALTHSAPALDIGIDWSR